MKIGIITRYTRDTVNYGNVLQTYALNCYLREKYPEHSTETVVMSDDYNIGKVKTSYIVAAFRKVLSMFRKEPAVKTQTPNQKRLELFQRFADDNIALSKVLHSEKELGDQQYEVLIVGSDVVWSQVRNNYNRIKFLCFVGSENALKLSYAASFGRDYIPFENRKAIRRALSSFRGISVRESSSVKLLESIGIKNAVHVCDPTLLLSGEHWRKIEEEPEDIDGIAGKGSLEDIYNPDMRGFMLVLLLNAEKWQIDRIQQIKADRDLRTIAVSNGYIEDKLLSPLFDKTLDAISPGEWLWLIDHADMVITDSFHCMIFSSIFHKDFIVLERTYNTNINNRMIDFLDMIGCSEKFIRAGIAADLSKASLDYNSINKKVEVLVNSSKKFIDSMLTE